VGAWGTGSPMYGWGYSGYSNPYSGGFAGAGAGAQAVAPQQGAAAPYNYSQPISTTAAPPEQAVASQSASALDQAREAFKAGDYGKALQLDQQALGQAPNDTTLHEFLGLVYFAQGKYDQAAEPLYAVLSVGPGWDWTTVSGMYPDVETYTTQLRALEASLRANPDSAPARFVLAYQYLVQGHDQNAVDQLKAAVKLQPGDTLSAQLIAHLQPTGAPQPATADAAPADAPADLSKLAGTWTATPAKDAKIALAIKEDGKFSWDVSNTGKPSTTIAGASTFTDGVLTLAAQGTKDGALTGKVAWKDADHFTFRLVGAPPSDPGLSFAR
jgi:tetratricopeptide (TPR) repeat protein